METNTSTLLECITPTPELMRAIEKEREEYDKTCTQLYCETFNTYWPGQGERTHFWTFWGPPANSSL